MLTAPKLDSALIERERGVILREMEEVNQQQVSQEKQNETLSEYPMAMEWEYRRQVYRIQMH